MILFIEQDKKSKQSFILIPANIPVIWLIKKVNFL